LRSATDPSSLGDGHPCLAWHRSAIIAALAAIGHEVAWLPAGRSTDTRNRAGEAGLQSVDDLTGCALVASVVPPSAAVETATSMAGFAGHVVDANAISTVSADEVCRIVTDGEAGIRLADKPSPLYRLLVLSLFLSRNVRTTSRFVAMFQASR
jgi:hypothetical protein